jgi:membrane protease YdiL (CAAX protease family)
MRSFVGSRRGEVVAVGATLGYNAILNRVLPDPVHVPANLATAGGLLAYAKWHGASFADLGLDPSAVPAGLATGLAFAVPVAVSVAATSAPPRTRDLFADRRITDMSARQAVYEMVVRIPIGTALAEELIFRGALFGLFKRNHSQWTALALSSAMFGLWHIAPTIESMRTHPAGDEIANDPKRIVGSVTGIVLATAAAGAVFGLLRVRTKSVVAPVLVHAAINGAAFGTTRILANLRRRGHD